MMAHYVETKDLHKDHILFYRLGDFYEMFFDDAVLVSRELNLTLTGKQCGLEEKAPMCGVPFHAAENYISKLVSKGYKVAICEQVEDPKEAKGMVKRQVVKVVTPGTITSETLLSEKENNYIASVNWYNNNWSMAYGDVSTGELYLIESCTTIEYLLDLINKIEVKELLVNGDFQDKDWVKELENHKIAITWLTAGSFSEKTAWTVIEKELGTEEMQMLKGSGHFEVACALGALLSYLMDTQRQALSQFKRCQFHKHKGAMTLDRSTMRNLEIMETLYEKRVEGSLLGIIDKTKTAMGARLMRNWLKGPLTVADDIKKRLDATEVLFSHRQDNLDIRKLLNEIYDFQRLTTKITAGSANGRDLLALKNSLLAIPAIKNIMSGLEKTDLIEEIRENLDGLPQMVELINTAIKEDAPITIREGGLIKDGYSSELDQLKDSIKDAKTWIGTLESKLREELDIKTVKVGYNKVFGYYIEVPRSVSNKVPDTFIRKQTLVNNERFITPELKEMESLVLNAEVKINQLEYQLFMNIKDTIAFYADVLQEVSSAVSKLDVLASFAYVSYENAYVKPEITEDRVLEIVGGRHPVVEKMEKGNLFIANDVNLDGSATSLALITGPNMAGKSTYMRQIAISVLMAQAGCFVPADKAVIGVVDQIFTRIGASDNLSQGQSTFFVEMHELAYILKKSTDRSLIILDEIGRGTSTFDGLAIAWSAAEKLASGEYRPRTLFATHYHQLTEVAQKHSFMENFNVDVADNNGQIIFLHKIVKGAASESYGVHVAKLAGVPQEVVMDAEIRLKYLESQDNMDFKDTALSFNAELIEASNLAKEKYDSLKSKIEAIDIMSLTPGGAISLIEQLKAEIDD